MNSGQISGLIADLPTVKELLDMMMGDANLQLQSAAKLLN
jgi:enoyl-[acyl-carrier protein] reductase II